MAVVITINTVFPAFVGGADCLAVFSAVVPELIAEAVSLFRDLPATLSETPCLSTVVCTILSTPCFPVILSGGVNTISNRSLSSCRDSVVARVAVPLVSEETIALSSVTIVADDSLLERQAAAAILSRSRTVAAVLADFMVDYF